MMLSHKQFVIVVFGCLFIGLSFVLVVGHLGYKQQLRYIAQCEEAGGKMIRGRRSSYCIDKDVFIEGVFK